MKIPFPAFIKRIFERPNNDKRVFDVRNAQSSQDISSPTRQFVTGPSLEKKSSFACPLEQHSAIGKYMPTPIPQTPVFLRSNHRQGPYIKDLTSMRLSRFPSVLSTPMVVSSLASLESSTTPADAFSDILDIIVDPSVIVHLTNRVMVGKKARESTGHQTPDTPKALYALGLHLFQHYQSWPANTYESSPLLISGSQIHSVTDSVCVTETPANDLVLIEMLMTVAEQIESERSVSSGSYLNTQPDDVLISRNSTQRKCHHAKLMTEDEKKYYRKNRSKERRKKQQCPTHGVRRSTRIKKSAQRIY